MKHFFQKQSQFSLHSPQQKNNQPIEAYYNLIQDKGENSPSFHFENAKNNFRNSSLIDEECCQTDGYSTFYKTEQSNQFTNTNDGWFKKIPKAENALKLKGLDHKSNNSTPHCIRPKAISLTSQTSSFLNRIQDPQVQRKQSVQVFTTRNSTFGHSQQQKIEHPQPTASDQIQNKKTQRKKKQEKIYKQTERVLKEIEVRKHTFTTFGFKAQEKSEDPLLQYTINKMLNSNRPKGSMFVTDLWPESNVKQFISYQKMGQGKYIMRKIAQQAFKQSTDNYHSQPKTLTRKDEEGVYYFFKDNAPNDNRQQKQIQTVFQSKDSKYEKLIKKFVPQEQGEYQLNSNVYKYDPNACSEIVEQIYQQNYQDKKLEEIENLSRQLNYAVFKSVEQNLLHKDDNETWGDKQYSESS